MARLSKRDEAYLKRCRHRLGAAKRYRDTEGHDARWKRLIDLYNGKHFQKTLSAEDKIVVNLAFSTINVIGPSVAVNHPSITVNARQSEDHDKAAIVEAVVNYWWKHYDLQDELRRAVDDFLILGFGWIKTGYRYVEEQQNDPTAFNEAFDAQVAEADAYAEENPELAGDLPTDDEIAESIGTPTKTAVVEDRPFAERVSAFDIYVDPEATSLRDAKWIAQKVIKPLEEVRADKRYASAARAKVEPDGRLNDDWRPADCPDKEGDFQRVTVWEFYDLATGTMCVFSEIGDSFLVAPIDQPYSFGHPFVMLRNYDVPDAFYPMGELEAIEALQQELNATRTAQLNDRKQKGRAWVYDERAFDKAGKARLLSNDDNRLIPTNGSIPLSEVIIPLPSQQLDAQMYQNSDIIENDIDRITGINEYARGALPEVRRTATEASIIQDAANSRAADKLAKVEKVISLVARRLVQLAQEYLTEEQVARIEGQNGALVWFTFQPDDIQGEFDYDVESGSTAPKNDTARRQTAMEMLQTLMPLADPAMGLVNGQELVKYALQYGFDVKDPERFMGQGPMPPEQPMGPQESDDGPPIPDGPQPPQGGAFPSPQTPLPQGGPQDMAQMLAGQVGQNFGTGRPSL